MKTLYNGDCLDLLETGEKWDCIIADPPDNIGLAYAGHKDKLPEGAYYDWLHRRLAAMLKVTSVLWFTYYWKHDLEVKFLIRNLLKYTFPSFEAKNFVWTFTFGQHCETDSGSNFRLIVRLRLRHIQWSPPSRVQSERLKMGDPRANPDGKIPGDWWDVPRVTGNSKERQSWHPTQIPEEIYRRMLDSSRIAGKLPGKVLDCFGGTGTLFRVSTEGTICEISKEYTSKLLEEHQCTLKSLS